MNRTSRKPQYDRPDRVGAALRPRSAAALSGSQTESPPALPGDGYLPFGD